MSDKVMFRDCKAIEGLELKCIEGEIWREYDFPYSTNKSRVYRIESPVALYYRKDGTTHRVVDADGVAHSIPAPGFNGCVMRWVSKTNFVHF